MTGTKIEKVAMICNKADVILEKVRGVIPADCYLDNICVAENSVRAEIYRSVDHDDVADEAFYDDVFVTDFFFAWHGECEDDFNVYRLDNELDLLTYRVTE